MRKLQLLFTAAVLLVAATATAAPPDPALAGWERGQVYDRQYDANLEVVVPAVVVKVEKFTPMEGMAEGVRAQVQARGETFWVHLAPAAWLAAQGFELGDGQQVVVTGSYLKLDGERVILAAKLERDGKTTRMRDESGKPMWASWRPRPA
jgi:hypothetical protein